MTPVIGNGDAPEPVLVARAVGVAYGTTTVLRAVDLEIAAGETVALLGPSGSGKTTLLYAIAGFLPVTQGRIELGGRLVSAPGESLPPERRSVGMVFQHYGLWPHLDALDSVAYPLRRSGLGKDAARAEALELLRQLRIERLASRHPAELSGGEQQRVGLARALARRPALYLLDEPTAHLDTALKADLQAELALRMRTDGAAALHATHDVDEALAVADRVVLLRDGEIVQVGRPTEVYAQPVDAWAATHDGPGLVRAPGRFGGRRWGDGWPRARPSRLGRLRGTDRRYRRERGLPGQSHRLPPRDVAGRAPASRVRSTTLVERDANELSHHASLAHAGVPLMLAGAYPDMRWR